ncbi:MAG: amino acid adenylation domain-containing protein [Planctomycetota bacterium]|jgi:amino acid adenylation domain-containing protein
MGWLFSSPIVESVEHEEMSGTNPDRMMPEAHVYRRFCAVVRQHTDCSALSFQHGEDWREWTYAQLMEKVTRIGESLAGFGVGRGDAVGLMGRRHPNTFAAILGILHVGAHYVPLDPAQPEWRARMMFEAVGVKLVIDAAGGDDDAIPSIRAVDGAKVDRRQPPKPSGVASQSSNEPAYVMFTSGSSGKPRAVVVPHRAITRLVVDQDYLRFGSDRVFLQAASMGFDASTLEIWGPLLNGGKSVIYPSGLLPTSQGLRSVIAARGVTTAWLTASLFHAIVSRDVQSLAPLEELIIGGEPLSVPHVRKALAELPGTQLINGYGPTENTTFSACYRIPKELSRSVVRVPIGRAIRGTTLTVVDEALRPVEPGKEGELVAMGDGLALGYLHELGNTSKQFVKVVCPDGVAHAGYRTGDRVVELPDGLFDFVGRRDDQVKIHGNRIEPGEVGAVIGSLAGVHQCYVHALPNPLGDVRLAAYVVLADGTTVVVVQEALAEMLPPFMVPHQIIALSALPMNANGKIDRESLPAPWPTPVPSSSTSGHLAMVEQSWIEVLGHLPESADVNFFDAGGRSLDVILLHDLLEQRLVLSLEPTFVFEYATVRRQAAELARVLAKAGAKQPDSSGGFESGRSS